jgi:hypothetical protein
VLASLGLLLNSPAVIIGAMLVASLMSAIVSLGLGVIEGDTDLLGAAAWASVRGMALAILVGALLGLVIPDAAATSEIMGRARPSVLDLGVALILPPRCGALVGGKPGLAGKYIMDCRLRQLVDRSHFYRPVNQARLIHSAT